MRTIHEILMAVATFETKYNLPPSHILATKDQMKTIASSFGIEFLNNLESGNFRLVGLQWISTTVDEPVVALL